MPEAPCISLTTDFGLDSSYVGQMKAVIAGIHPAAKVIDLTHAIQPHHVAEAAFILGNAYGYFPAGTVHVAVVDPGVGTDRRILALRTDQYTFLAPDNGLLTVVLEKETPRSIVEVSNRKYFINKFFSHTFQGRHVFAPVAAHLAAGLDIAELGLECAEIALLPNPKPVAAGDRIDGQVMFVDHFGNVITNIHKSHVDGYLTAGKGLRAECGGAVIDRFVRAYADAGPGEPLLLINSFDLLEIACNKSRADVRFKLKAGDAVAVHATPPRPPAGQPSAKRRMP